MGAIQKRGISDTSRPRVRSRWLPVWHTLCLVDRSVLQPTNSTATREIYCWLIVYCLLVMPSIWTEVQAWCFLAIQLAVPLSPTLRDKVSLLGGEISVKVHRNIHHVSWNCWEGFQSPRSKVKIICAQMCECYNDIHFNGAASRLCFYSRSDVINDKYKLQILIWMSMRLCVAMDLLHHTCNIHCNTLYLSLHFLFFSQLLQFTWFLLVDYLHNNVHNTQQYY